MGVIRVAHISDIHFGAMPGNRLYDELKHNFLEKLKKDPVDGIFMAGDIFHEALSVNSSHFRYLVMFFESLMNLAEETKISFIRIIKGTRSHDLDQLDNIVSLIENYNVDVKIITTVTVEKIFVKNDMVKVLYIPEECMNSHEEYYAPYLEEENAYDFIVGHGIVTETSFEAKKQTSAITMMKAPVLESIKLERSCKGPILYGHIHNKCIIRERIFYSGSFTRWCFGEEDSKGFNIIEYDTKTSQYSVSHIENVDAVVYKTIPISFKNGCDIFKEVEKVSNIVDMRVNPDYKVRLIFAIPEDFSDPALLTNTINEFFNMKKNVTVVISNNSRVKAKQEMDKKIDTIMKRFGVIFDKSVEFEVKLRHFIKTQYSKEIPLEDIQMYLHEDITKNI